MILGPGHILGYVDQLWLLRQSTKPQPCDLGNRESFGGAQGILGLTGATRGSKDHINIRIAPVVRPKTRGMGARHGALVYGLPFELPPHVDSKLQNSPELAKVHN